MSAPRILLRDIAQDATFGTPSPVLLTTMPVENLLTQPRREVARTTGLATQVITLTWPTNQICSVVALCRNNLRTAGSIQAEGFSDTALTTPIFDSTALAAFSTANLAQADVDDYLENDFRGFKNWVYYPTRVTAMKGLRITLIDAVNPDGYMEASRLFVGDYFEFAYTPPTGGEGAQQGTLTKQGRSDGGDLWSDRGADFQIQRIDANFIEASELPSVLAVARRLGMHRDFWFDLLPGDTSAWGIYRRGQRKFVNLGQLDASNFGLFSQTLTMEEP